MTDRRVSPETLKFLSATDTCVVSNAIEAFNMRLRNEGFINGTTRCLLPELGPVAGYAVPGRLRSSAPPIAGRCYYNRLDWWDYVAQIPSPRIIVMEDVDRNPGTGALFGEIHAQIAEALQCVAYISNGTVRDMPGLRAAAFQCFASGLGVSHSYAHVIEFGEPVEIGGLKISPGDLLHGDCHGVQSIPFEIADRLPGKVAEITAREAKLIELCRAPGFTIERLHAALKEDDSSCPPPERL